MIFRCAAEVHRVCHRIIAETLNAIQLGRGTEVFHRGVVPAGHTIFDAATGESADALAFSHLPDSTFGVNPPALERRGILAAMCGELPVLEAAIGIGVAPNPFALVRLDRRPALDVDVPLGEEGRGYGGLGGRLKGPAMKNQWVTGLEGPRLWRLRMA